MSRFSQVYNNFIDNEDLKGKRYKILEDNKVLCCSYLLKENDIVEIFKRTSKNRILISVVGHNGLHKIKLSTLNRISNGI